MIDMGYNLERLKEIAEPRSKETIDKFNKRYLKRHSKMWHNSNEEQPDGKRRTVCYCLNTNGGEVGIHTIVNPNYRWAYLEDLDPEYVECGNCVNDKGCIVCEHGKQKQLC